MLAHQRGPPPTTKHTRKSVEFAMRRLLSAIVLSSCANQAAVAPETANVQIHPEAHTRPTADCPEGMIDGAEVSKTPGCVPVEQLASQQIPASYCKTRVRAEAVDLYYKAFWASCERHQLCQGSNLTLQGARRIVGALREEHGCTDSGGQTTDEPECLEEVMAEGWKRADEFQQHIETGISPIVVDRIYRKVAEEIGCADAYARLEDDEQLCLMKAYHIDKIEIGGLGCNDHFCNIADSEPGDEYYDAIAVLLGCKK